MLKMTLVGLVRKEMIRINDGDGHDRPVYDEIETSVWLHQCLKCMKVKMSPNEVEFCEECE